MIMGEGLLGFGGDARAVQWYANDHVNIFTSSPSLPFPPLASPPTQHLYNTATAGDIPGMLCALAQGANVNFINEAEDGRSPLIQTIHSGSLGATEFLMLNGVRPNLRDSLGRGVLHHCVLQGAST